MIVRKLYVGIDVHRAEHRVAILPIEMMADLGDHWKRCGYLTISNNIKEFCDLEAKIRQYVRSPGEVAIAVDQTGHYSEPLVGFLCARHYSVYYLEPKAVKAAKERLLDQESKSDSFDAASAAYLLYLRDVHGISFRISAVKPELCSKASIMRHMILDKQQYVKMSVQATNRLHSFLMVVFPEAEAKFFPQLLKIIKLYPTPEDILAGKNMKGIKGVSAEDKEAISRCAAETVGVSAVLYRDLIRDLCSHRNDAQARRKNIDAILNKEVANHPYGPILLSFPYFGSVAAATIIGIVQDIDRWPSKKKLKKALGVYAISKQSGNSGAKTRQGREGSKHGRRVLFQIVGRCIQRRVPDNDFRDHYQRQVASGKPKLKAIVSTMGKLAELIYHCLKANETYQYQRKYRAPSRGDGRIPLRTSKAMLPMTDQ